jgi:hypothetical protein
MVLDEVRRGACTIPTIQTLLLLSAQECSLGNSTQAWVYSGMAFRLVDHLGVSFDVQRYGGSVTLSDEDLEIRRRLFWSCYFWDKVISLYLGRPPSLQQTPVSPPQWIREYCLTIIFASLTHLTQSTILPRMSCGVRTV